MAGTSTAFKRKTRLTVTPPLSFGFWTVAFLDVILEFIKMNGVDNGFLLIDDRGQTAKNV
jgi:hypothetical protein